MPRSTEFAGYLAVLLMWSQTVSGLFSPHVMILRRSQTVPDTYIDWAKRSGLTLRPRWCVSLSYSVSSNVVESSRAGLYRTPTFACSMLTSRFRFLSLLRPGSHFVPTSKTRHALRVCLSKKGAQTVASSFNDA